MNISSAVEKVTFRMNSVSAVAQDHVLDERFISRGTRRRFRWVPILSRIVFVAYLCVSHAAVVVFDTPTAYEEMLVGDDIP